MIRMTLNTSTTLQYAMPIISKKKYTFWCQDCNAVFDELANEHQEKENYRMNQTEYFASC